MKILEVILKQHTPLIHFQHTQYGATLRASEVKPKLDRFLLSRLGGEKKESWLLRTSSILPALDYKIRIQPCEKKSEYLVASYLNRYEKDYLKNEDIRFIGISPYFAQEKQNKEIINGNISLDDLICTGIIFKNKRNDPEKNNSLRSVENLIVTISSFKKDLVEFIAEQIQTFFLIENFGSRQNKGFGCFEVKFIKLMGSDRKYVLEPNEDILASNFQFCYKKTMPKKSLSNIFKTITDDYKLLKSGKNDSECLKSKLMLYGKDKKMRWEKKFLKENIDNVFQKNENSKYELFSLHKKNTPIKQDEHFTYLRALLGTANQYEFLLKNPPAPKKKMLVSVKGVDGVERFKSPIMFKVLEENIYMVGNNMPEEIFNKEFYFEVTVEGDSSYENVKIEKTLKTPESFNLIDFMNDYSNILGYENIK